MKRYTFLLILSLLVSTITLPTKAISFPSPSFKTFILVVGISFIGYEVYKWYRKKSSRSVREVREPVQSVQEPEDADQTKSVLDQLKRDLLQFIRYVNDGTFHQLDDRERKEILLLMLRDQLSSVYSNNEELNRAIIAWTQLFKNEQITAFVHFFIKYNDLRKQDLVEPVERTDHEIFVQFEKDRKHAGVVQALSKVIDEIEQRLN